MPYSRTTYPLKVLKLGRPLELFGIDLFSTITVN